MFSILRNYQTFPIAEPFCIPFSMHILTIGKFSLKLDPPSEIYHEHSASLGACSGPHPYFFSLLLPFACLSGSFFSCINDVSSYLLLYTCGDFLTLTLKTEDPCAWAVSHTVVTIRVCMASYRKN